MKNEVFRCNICGRIVEVLEDGQGPIVCCGQPMKKLEPNTVDASHEKHVPIIEKTKNGYLVKVGSEPHPMENSHYIQWIEIRENEEIQRIFLNPDDKPEANFCITAKNPVAIIYCNLHGLWSS